MASYSSWREGIQRVQGLEAPAHVIARIKANTDDLAAWLIEDVMLARAMGTLRFEGLDIPGTQEVVAQKQANESLRMDLEAVRVRGLLGDTLTPDEMARYERIRDDGSCLPSPPPHPLPRHWTPSP